MLQTKLNYCYKATSSLDCKFVEIIAVNDFISYLHHCVV